MSPLSEREAYLALALTPGIGIVRLAALRRAFGSFGEALAAPIAVLRAVEGMNLAAATAVVTADRTAVPNVIEATRRLGAVVAIPGDRHYPEPLTRIGDPPAMVFLLGRLELLDRPAVAIVGTRRPSGYGIEVTRDVATSAAAGGITVVSGLARGLDAVAHWAALDQPGSTIGVLGNGLGVVYPSANRALYQRVAAEGLLLTEYPPGERPNAGSFLARNRLISGLARVTVVTEAPDRSGAITTATNAAEQSRDVLAVPGLVTSRSSVGTNALIRDGAGLYLGPADLFRFYPETTAPPSDAAPTVEVPPRLRLVFGGLDGMPRSIDELARTLRLNAGEVAGALTELEVAGLAIDTGGGFARVR